ncbi:MULTISPECIES: hypothetical protein [unclassified Pseudonocardia]|nr:MULTISPECIES: hypothetical protein [unclassified Pseudonocardia]
MVERSAAEYPTAGPAYPPRLVDHDRPPGRCRRTPVVAVIT